VPAYIQSIVMQRGPERMPEHLFMACAQRDQIVH